MNRINPIPPANRKATAYYYEQGRLFEEYIKNLFNQDSFKLKRWRKSALIPPDTFISDICYPDLELIFVGMNQYSFAVECKWRSKFNDNGKIEWASEEQIAAYLAFERKRAMPVFIAIGVGGTASNPKKLFVTPLCNLIRYPEVYEHQLINYKRKPTQSFFYDTVQLRLW
jgi:hypothetical protein